MAESLDRFPPVAGKPIVEIGAGTGQLRAWMPPAWRERSIHTDPSESALRLLRDRAPDAKTRVASAHHLPFDDGAVGAVVGLCVFDVLPDEAAAVAEIGRVLAPGGCFVHLMDMATLLEAPFAKLAASGLVPIPNVFGDPGDHEWPLDIVLVKRDWLDGLLGLATGVGSPLSAELGGYCRAFFAMPFDTNAATKSFKAVASNGEKRHALLTLLESAGRLAFTQGFPPIQPLPFHSGRYLQSVMESAFRNNDAFRIELDEIVTRSEWRASAQTAPEGSIHYRSLCLGHQRILDALPRRLLNESTRNPAGSAPDRPSTTLTEVGAFVFVARRTA